VEDSQQGLRAALAAGIATLIVSSSYTRDDDFRGAALVLASLEDAATRLGASSALNALRTVHG
jgi:beta-phosphoglucomutase-like phosphatase (HAD superfamily)